MSAARKSLPLFPPPAHMNQSRAIEHLGRQVLIDAIDAGWLTYCVRKPGRGKDTVFYRFSDVHDVSLRIGAGEYPTPDPEVVKKKQKGARGTA